VGVLTVDVCVAVVVVVVGDTSVVVVGDTSVVVVVVGDTSVVVVVVGDTSVVVEGVRVKVNGKLKVKVKGLVSVVVVTVTVVVVVMSSGREKPVALNKTRIVTARSKAEIATLPVRRAPLTTIPTSLLRSCKARQGDC
jgi:hypothetical protein